MLLDCACVAADESAREVCNQCDYRVCLTAMQRQRRALTDQPVRLEFDESVVGMRCAMHGGPHGARQRH
jgi:hypothetical protein